MKMKKTRYIPYGYTVRNGRTVIDHTEADIIREIFDQYICGASLKNIAEMLTIRKVPYTERTDVWDKARIARIIDNAKYIGDGDYDAIIGEDIYENAVRMKSARSTLQVFAECEGIATIRNRVKCECCNSPMLRHHRKSDHIKESWVCTNDECGMRVKISDGQLIEKITILINRIIKNSDLMKPQAKQKYIESPAVKALQAEIDRELEKGHPSEDLVMDKIGEMASTMYAESDSHKQIVASIAKRRVAMMIYQETFNSEYFKDIVSYITLDKNVRVTIHTKTETEIKEGENDDGSSQDT